MTARLYLTVYADDDLPTETSHIVSKSLGTVTACTELTYTKHLHGTGALKLKINRHHPQAALLIADRYVIVHSDIGPIGGAFLESAPIDLSAAEGKGDEWMEWTGRGPIAVLERVVMDNSSNVAGGHQPIAGFWDLSAQGIAGIASNGHPIPMMKRVLNEVDLNPPNGIAMVDHSSWYYDEDSNAVAPPFWGEIIYGADVGDNALALAAEMSLLGGIVWEMTHLFQFNAYLSYGTDRQGAFGAAGKVRFEKGVNIADAIQRTVRGSVLRTHLVVGGADRTYIKVTDPDYVSGDVVRWGYLSVPETADLGALEEAGLAHIEARKRQTDVWSFPQHDHGDSIAAGIYEPGPPGTAGAHYWVGDTVTLHSGTGLYDANELGVPISVITWQLKTGEEANGDYWVIPQVGATFDWPPPGPGQQHVPPAPPSTGGEASCLLSPTDMTPVSTPNGGFEDGNINNWTIDEAAPAGSRLQSDGDTPDGSTYWYALNTSGHATYSGFSGTFIAGQTYVAHAWIRGGDSLWVRFGFEVGGTDNVEILGVSTSPTAYQRVCLEWTPSANRAGTGVRFVITTVAPATDSFDFDALQVYTGETADTPVGGPGADPGTPGTYAPIDHDHDAVYNGDAAGGDLGGTYPDPTVNATHSGSAHHVEDHAARHADGGADEVAVESLSTAETDTALVLGPDGGGGVQFRAETGGASDASVGELLISDTPSTPLIFADLIQNEAQDDLVYSD